MAVLEIVVWRITVSMSRCPLSRVRKRVLVTSHHNNFATMSRQGYSEDELGQKWNKCITDLLLKTGGGVGIGAVCSLLFFSRRGWPLLLGGGFGIGMAYSNCERALNESIAGKTTNVINKQV